MPYKTKEQLNQYYLRNKEKYITARKALAIEKRQYIIELKEKTPCTDCGKKYPYYVMDFDHLNDKKIALSKISLYSWKTILEEIDKCEIVCANCHRVRTFKRIEDGN